jgi:hypothetical protein
MGTDTLQQQLAACIKTALEQHGFSKPKTPDTSITDAYADAATAVVMRHLQAAGWTLVKGSGDWSPDRVTGPAELEEMLRRSLRFPLLKAKKRPRRRDDAEMADYHRAIAEEVARHLVQGGWSLAPALVKNAPLPPPSSSRFMSKDD